jgi:sortase A
MQEQGLEIMAKDRRPAEELSISELEALLARKKMEARQARVRQFERRGRVLNVGSEPPLNGIKDAREPEGRSALRDQGLQDEAGKGKPRPLLNRALFAVEIVAVLALVYILLNGAGALKKLNAEVASALSVAPSPTPLISAVVLPSGHTPPTTPGGARPNDAEIPENLRPLVQSLPSVTVPTPGPEQARSIFIPALWNDAAPVVQGDGWEQLKRGVGQYIGSPNPGQNGNLVLSAHNDMFGELFRDLDRLKPGDEVLINTATQQFTYRVTGMKIVEPTEVGVLEPTSKPTITLISCYPYLVDNQRIVVFGELAEG